MLCFACGLYLGWAAGQMFGRGALLSLTSVLNATSDEPALTTGDTIQPHSLFDLLKPLQTPTPAFWTLTFVLLDFFFYYFISIIHYLCFSPLSLSFLGAKRDPYRSTTPAINFFARFRRDGTWLGYCTPGRRWVGGGWRRTARLIPPFYTRLFSPLRFQPSAENYSRLLDRRLPCGLIFFLVISFVVFLAAAAVQPSCAVTWRLNSKTNIEKTGLHSETGYGVSKDESNGGGEGICGEDPGSYVQVRTGSSFCG